MDWEGKKERGRAPGYVQERTGHTRRTAWPWIPTAQSILSCSRLANVALEDVFARLKAARIKGDDQLIKLLESALKQRWCEKAFQNYS